MVSEDASQKMSSPSSDVLRGSFMATSWSLSSVQFSCSVVSDSLWPHGSMPGLPVHHQLLELAQTHPLSRWCHPTISSSIIPFSSCLQSFPASGSFQSWSLSSFIYHGQEPDLWGLMGLSERQRPSVYHSDVFSNQALWTQLPWL